MIRIGILCPSEIAIRRFMPALVLNSNFEFKGIGVSNATEWYGENVIIDNNANSLRVESELNKAQAFIDFCGSGEIYNSYEELITSDEIDAIYIPLPPALHFKWAKMALENNKHVFVEKPSTTSYSDTKKLIEIARNRNISLHENYMFIYHDQIKKLKEVVENGVIGDVRLYRISFGFPLRKKNDFRYNKSLGGGSLIDAGGYTIKYASYLLGESARITDAHLNYVPSFDVDLFGSATMINDKGLVAQLAFGMDNDYKCSIEIWGSIGTITSDRILTAPADFEPTYILKRNQQFETIQLPIDNAFSKSISRFYDCIISNKERETEYDLIEEESKLLEEFKKLASK